MISSKTSKQEEPVDFDSVEAKKIQAMTERQQGVVKKPYDFEKAAQTVLNQIPMTDATLLQRWKNVIVSYLKDIRDSLETRTTLLRDRSLGGLGFTREETDRVMGLLNEEHKKLEEYVDAVVVEERTKDAKQLALPRTRSVLLPKPKDVPTNTIKSSNTSASKSPEIVTRLVGPIEELRRLTLVDFRRLSPDAVLAAQRIRQRILLIGQESIEKRLKGIQAWRSSDVHEAYCLLGYICLERNKNIDQIIEERIAHQEETLTRSEFDAIMEMNASLRM
jgi:hypothetical protein